MAWWSSQIGFLATDRGIYRTTTGGRTWKLWLAASAPMSPYQGLSPVGPQTLWATTDTQLVEIAGSAPHIIKRHAGLRNALATQSSYVDFVSPQHGYILNDGTIQQVDATPAIALRKASPAMSVQSMAWASGTVGWAASGSHIWKTTDGGQHWTDVFSAPVAPTGWNGQIVANSTDDVWDLMVGEGSAGQTAYVFWHSTNGGQTWTCITDNAFSQATSYPHLPPSQVSMNPGPVPGAIAPIGLNGVIFLGWNNNTSHWQALWFDGHTWHLLVLPSTRSATVPQITGQPNPLAFSSPTMGWLAGANQAGQGVLLASQNGGQTWSPWPLHLTQ